MGRIEDLLNGQIEPGIYRVPANADPATIQRAAEEHGWRVFHVDGATIRDKRSFIRTTGDAMDFPAYSGQNWDAFEESLRDLSWVPARGYVLLIDQPGQFIADDPEQWRVAQGILRDAIGFWREQGAPMAVLLRRAGRALPDISWL